MLNESVSVFAALDALHIRYYARNTENSGAAMQSELKQRGGRLIY